MQEREVTRTVPQRLRAEGLVGLKACCKNERGPDIEGYLPRSRRKLFIEAKGERAGADRWGEGANCWMAMGEALLQVLSVYDQDVVCGIAVPYTKEFQKVLQNILPGFQKLGLHVLLVREGEVWHLGPHATGFFPEKSESLIEILEQ